MSTAMSTADGSRESIEENEENFIDSFHGLYDSFPITKLKTVMARMWNEKYPYIFGRNMLVPIDKIFPTNYERLKFVNNSCITYEYDKLDDTCRYISYIAIQFETYVEIHRSLYISKSKVPCVSIIFDKYKPNAEYKKVFLITEF